MLLKEEWAPAAVLLLGFWGSMLSGSLADAAPTFPLKAFWKLLGCGLWFGMSVWVWLLLRQKRQLLWGVVTATLFGLAGLFSLLSLYASWRVELIARPLGQG